VAAAEKSFKTFHPSAAEFFSKKSAATAAQPLGLHP
jgi:hypothetical protein